MPFLDSSTAKSRSPQFYSRYEQGRPVRIDDNDKTNDKCTGQGQVSIPMPCQCMDSIGKQKNLMQLFISFLIHAKAHTTRFCFCLRHIAYWVAQYQYSSFSVLIRRCTVMYFDKIITRKNCIWTSKQLFSM